MLGHVGKSLDDITAEDLAVLTEDEDPRKLAAKIDRVGTRGQSGTSQRLTSRTSRPTSEAEAARLEQLSPKELAAEVSPRRF